MPSCHDVAEYFIALGDEESGDTISNLKIQKLLYYAQGLHLAFYDKPLFGEKLWAWTHGPVVTETYHRFKQHENRDIPLAECKPGIEERLSEAEREFLDEVYNVYGQFSAWKLRQMTHDEPPWKETPHRTEITHAALKSYFKTRLTDA